MILHAVNFVTKSANAANADSRTSNARVAKNSTDVVT
jgi:hypothetical protein